MMIGLNRLAVVAVGFAITLAMAGTSPATTMSPTKIVVHLDRPGSVIDRHIYGQFAEHLGRGVYQGVWVGENSPIPNTRGYRNDVLQALRELKVPDIRWPGGCFADEYYWREGIGPRDKRPVRVNTNWGGTTESNAFGTNEFMDFAELIGADAYVSGDIGSTEPRNMADWVEYITSPTRSTLAELRRANDRDKPWRLPLFGVGNEVWGCGGNMRPEFAADMFRRYQTFVKVPAGEHLLKIASGPNADDYTFTDVMMREAHEYMGGLSLHYYTVPTGDWTHKGASTGFGEDAYIATLARSLRMDELVTRHSAIMDKYDPEKKVALVVDEWGVWTDPSPGTNPGFLQQQNSLRDAIVSATTLNIFHDHADRVRMANIAQMVNVLQAMILTRGPRMVLTPTYYVFDMYKGFQDAVAIPVEVQSSRYSLGPISVPAVQASAARGEDGVMHISLVDLDADRSVTVEVSLQGGEALREVSGRVLTGPAVDSINSFERPDLVRPVALTGGRLEHGLLHAVLPPKSVTVLDLR